jgi:hypothetical protein
MTKPQFPKEWDEDGEISSLFDPLAPTGSKVICGPNPVTLPNDEDWVCLAPEGSMYGSDSPKSVSRVLARHGFTAESLVSYGVHEDARDMPINVNFGSWRRGRVNLIVTEKPQFYVRFVLATALAKALSLQAKQARINLFKAVLYGTTDDTIIDLSWHGIHIFPRVD